jgi:hypothetical protein
VAAVVRAAANRLGSEMKLLVLNAPRPFFHDSYRGTTRNPPCRWDNLPDDSEPNQLFFWFLSVSNGGGVVTDGTCLDRLRHLIHVYNRDDPAHPYELIELVQPGGTPDLGGTFLGIDLSLDGEGYSLLDGWGVPPERWCGGSDSSHPASILAGLIGEQFVPRLNAHWLFADEASARGCLMAVKALQSLAPGTFEYGDFQPVAIYRVQFA